MGRAPNGSSLQSGRGVTYVLVFAEAVPLDVHLGAGKKKTPAEDVEADIQGGGIRIRTLVSAPDSVDDVFPISTDVDGSVRPHVDAAEDPDRRQIR